MLTTEFLTAFFFFVTGAGSMWVLMHIFIIKAMKNEMYDREYEVALFFEELTKELEKESKEKK